MPEKRRTQSRNDSPSELAARHHRASSARSGARSGGRRRGLPAERKRTTTKRPRKRGQTRVKVSARFVFTVAAVLGVVFGGALLFRVVRDSQLLTVRHIEFAGTSRVPQDQLRRIVEQRTTAGKLWQIDLEALRSELRRHPWVRDVEVTRQLPDRLYVKVNEREPYALARRADNLIVWIDRDGTMIGERADFNEPNNKPLLSGLAEGVTAKVMETNRRHLDLYQRLLNDLDAHAPPLSPRVDEVQCDEVKGLTLNISDYKVSVLVGKQDFQARFTAALNILAAVERKDVSALRVLRVADAERLLNGKPIAYLNATLPDRVIIGLAE